ncbi:ferrous iron transport protein B [Methanobrevibacter arboriphilus]|jgi:ferrous iron transport protein B|uniref:Ferrous iron transport protein B n=1 Tax=Methanobrevibacter arboriphilus TaxID=39441 RepID=A0ACA8R0Y6_METAZ|nr:ferrous iron transport protein B [Methanobrevibacter arboriphilus]MCC7562598.1 ferrous iron transport protein B [Methanobrevibacter arboriphilus]BBL61256.1 ferrous iron transport protein B [Methanobrevibacter arboriphilus]GLI11411.1 ferrous iron transport protein B [Methanobrevibacter arboriphilus]
MNSIKIGLAGNPNVGKTTLFNQLTGLRQHVGNWPGKTVEKAEGHLNFNDSRIDVIDLPGNYALSAHSIEEIVSRDFIVDENSDVIVNIIDATNIERNLYLTTQMMELGANLVIALNMNKFAKKKEYDIDTNMLSELLGVPVVEIEAIDNTGKEELLEAVQNAAKNPIDSSKKLVYGTELTEHLDDLKNLIEKNKELSDVPSSWTAIKLLEDDDIIVEKVKTASNFIEIFNEVEKLKKHFKNVFGESSEEVVANYRYSYIDGLVKEAITKPEVEKQTITEKIDRVVTNRILGLPIFLVIMWIIFQITFTVGAPFQDLLDTGFVMLGDGILAVLGESWFSSLLVDGIIGGVGGVLVFLPQIFLMFLMISILEDSGYLARAAFVMDRIMHKFVGLHGKAFIPMILGFGCGVPGIMATRTMEHERDRILTMMIIPFMSCTARLPVYVLFVAAFFTAFQGEVIFSLYLLGIAVAIIIAAILKNTAFKGITTPFVMELPSYKLPSIKGVLIHTWEKGYGFIRKAGTIILAASIVVWVLSSVPVGVDYGSQESVIGQIGTVVAPIFGPLGFGEWQPSVALIFGVVAKEVVVGTFSSLFGVAEEGAGIESAMHEIFTPLSAYAFLVFVLLYVPCFAALGTIKQETNSWRWPLAMVGVTTVTAYIVSFIVYQGGTLLGFG